MTHDAEAIAGTGKYEEIVGKLRENGALSSCIEEMRNTYGGRLTLDSFVMTEHDWEMFTILGLYDIATLEHSIRTFELAYRIVTESFKGSSEETVILGNFLEQSDVSLKQFLRAALFHDIGKVIIPREVLRNALDDEEVLVRIRPERELAGKEEEKKSLLRMLYANGIRPIDIAQIKEVFAGEKYTELLCDLEKRGFSEKSTLKDVIRLHEPESKRILTALGYQTEGELAGCHHNYANEDNRHVVSVFGHSVGVADLIRIADVTDALRFARWYKKPLSELEVLFILVQDAEAGKVDTFVAYLWVKNVYAELQRKGEGMSLSMEWVERQAETRAIEAFLKRYEK